MSTYVNYLNHITALYSNFLQIIQGSKQHIVFFLSCFVLLFWLKKFNCRWTQKFFMIYWYSVASVNVLIVSFYLLNFLNMAWMIQLCFLLCVCLLFLGISEQQWPLIRWRWQCFLLIMWRVALMWSYVVRPVSVRASPRRWHTSSDSCRTIRWFTPKISAPQWWSTVYLLPGCPTLVTTSAVSTSMTSTRWATACH